jgi:hypothetical protein
MSYIDETANKFYHMFTNLDEACRIYCKNELFPAQNLRSDGAYQNFKLNKENNKIMIVISYCYRTSNGISYGSKSMPLEDMIAMAIEGLESGS